jgi:type I restriction enzyme, S subunit
MSIPKLRFPEFNGEFQTAVLEELVELTNTKYNPEKSNETLKCIELEHIAQETGTIIGFNNSGEQKSIKNKFVKGQILYGKLRPYLRKYWYATFDGVCSSEIWVLNGKKLDNRYLFQLVKTDKFNKIAGATSGTKMPRADWNYMKSQLISYPPIAEQVKMADFLSTFDSRIEAQVYKLRSLEELKNGIIQQIFSQELRFRGDNGKDYPQWEETRLSEILTETKLKSSGNLTICSVAVRKGVIDQIEHLGRSFAAANTENYKLVRYGDVIYTKSPTGDFPYGIFKQSFLKEDVAVSPLYGVFEPANVNIGYLLHSFFSYKENLNNYLAPIIQKGAKNTINITNSTFLSRSLWLPVSKDEQKKIADFLYTINEKISLETEIFKVLKDIKKGLLQQMFI